MQYLKPLFTMLCFVMLSFAANAQAQSSDMNTRTKDADAVPHRGNEQAPPYDKNNPNIVPRRNDNFKPTSATDTSANNSNAAPRRKPETEAKDKALSPKQ